MSVFQFCIYVVVFNILYAKGIHFYLLHIITYKAAYWSTSSACLILYMLLYKLELFLATYLLQASSFPSHILCKYIPMHFIHTFFCFINHKSWQLIKMQKESKLIVCNMLCMCLIISQSCMADRFCGYWVLTIQTFITYQTISALYWYFN